MLWGRHGLVSPGEGRRVVGIKSVLIRKRLGASPHRPSRTDIWPQEIRPLISVSVLLLNKDNPSDHERHRGPARKVT